MWPVIALLSVLTLREKRLRTGEHDLPEVPPDALLPAGASANGVSGSNGVSASNGTNGRFVVAHAEQVARSHPQRSTTASGQRLPD